MGLLHHLCYSHLKNKALYYLFLFFLWVWISEELCLCTESVAITTTPDSEVSVTAGHTVVQQYSRKWVNIFIYWYTGNFVLIKQFYIHKKKNRIKCSCLLHFAKFLSRFQHLVENKNVVAHSRGPTPVWTNENQLSNSSTRWCSIDVFDVGILDRNTWHILGLFVCNKHYSIKLRFKVFGEIKSILQTF